MACPQCALERARRRGSRWLPHLAGRPDRRGGDSGGARPAGPRPGVAVTPVTPLTPAQPVLGPLADDLARTALALARSFSAGATLWCVAPDWPEHAQHVAVEFVHPVIVGTRAFPAVAVVEPDLVAGLRPLVAGGDVLLAIAPADASSVAAVMRRAGAWGISTVWIGTGRRPPPGAADHVLWLDDADGPRVGPGALVLLYHVLWELTHVCFEHPGLLRDSTDGECEGPTCRTCADEGVLAEVVTPGAGAGPARVRTATGREQVDTTLVGPVAAGDLLLVHAGAAIGVVEAAGPVEGRGATR